MVDGRERTARTGVLAPAVAAAIALVATVLVVATDNPVQLRIGLLALCWAAVLGVFLHGTRRADRLTAERREIALRHEHELDLQRQASARRAADLAVENELRRESEEKMRAELAGLRHDLAVLAGAAGDADGVSDLRVGLADLAGLRAEVAALTRLRAELADLGDVRTELGRIRSELTDQPGELMVERMVMRAQSVRLPSERDDSTRIVPAAPITQALPAAQVAGAARTWEATGRIDSDQWPAEWQHTRVDRVLPAVEARPAVPRPEPLPHRRPPVPPSARTPRPAPQPVAEPVPAAQPAVPAADEQAVPTPMEWLVQESLLEPWVEQRPKSPLEWLSQQSLVTDAPSAAPAPAPRAEWSVPTTPRRHRRAAEPDDEPAAPVRPRGSHAAPDTAVGLDLGSRTPVEPEAPVHEVPAYEPPSWAVGSPTWSAESWSTSATTSATTGPADGWSLDRWSTGSSPAPAAEAPTREPARPVEDDWSAGSWSSSAPSDSLWSSPSAESSTSWSSSSPWEPAPAEPVVAEPYPTWSAPAARGSHAADDEAAGHARLAEILAQNEPRPSERGRRRRRYRDEDTPQDDVLSRVLGR